MRDHAPWAVAVGHADLSAGRPRPVGAARCLYRAPEPNAGLGQLFGVPMTHFTNATVEMEHLLRRQRGECACTTGYTRPASLAARAAIMDQALPQSLAAPLSIQPACGRRAPSCACRMARRLCVILSGRAAFPRVSFVASSRLRSAFRQNSTAASSG